MQLHVGLVYIHQQARLRSCATLCKCRTQVIDVLRTLHACWEAVDLDDALLRVTAALKLGLLLEGQAADDEDNASSLYEARDVLTRIRCVASRFRWGCVLLWSPCSQSHTQRCAARTEHPC